LSLSLNHRQHLTFSARQSITPIPSTTYQLRISHWSLSCHCSLMMSSDCVLYCGGSHHRRQPALWAASHRTTSGRA
jgi:hypothetical protein